VGGRQRVLSCAIAGCTFSAAVLCAQTPILPDDGLARLTVPSRLLPKTCHLAPVVKDANGNTTFVMYPGVRENPWIGNRQPTVAIIRRGVEGEPRDYETLTGPERLERGAIGTIEGYIARYLADDDGQVNVYAVRFTDPSLTLRASARRLAGEVPPIVFGATVVDVSYSRPTTRVKGTAATDACYDAVRKYVGTLK
jgi:hypothetical protein